MSHPKYAILAFNKRESPNFLGQYEDDDLESLKEDYAYWRYSQIGLRNLEPVPVEILDDERNFKVLVDIIISSHYLFENEVRKI